MTREEINERIDKWIDDCLKCPCAKTEGSTCRLQTNHEKQTILVTCSICSHKSLLHLPIDKFTFKLITNTAGQVINMFKVEIRN